MATSDWDKNFIMELKRRRKGVADGTVKTYTWEETKEAARKRVKSKRKS